MKSFLVGATVLTSVVGLGATAAFFGHDLIPQQKGPHTEEAPHTVQTSRDLTPQPIPLADTATEGTATDVAPSADPFASGLGQVQPAAAIEDRYADDAGQYPEVDPAVGHVPVEAGEPLPPADEALPVDDFEGDIPHASELNQQDPTMPGGADPLAAGSQATGPGEPAFAEQQAAAHDPNYADPADAAYPDPAELPNDAVGAPAELNTLQAPSDQGDFDRYGRPIPVGHTTEPTTIESAAPQAVPPQDNFAPADVAPANDGLHAVPTANSYAGDVAAPGADAATGVAPLAAGAGAAVGAVAGAAASDALNEGTGVPGDPRLSGTQAPTLTIEKTAPAEIQIGKPAKFRIKVRNAGSVDAHGVEIHDQVPQGTQFIGATPPASRGPSDELIWDLGTMKPGKEQAIELELMPTEEGEIGSVATIHFKAEASVRTVATKPILEMDVTAPERVMKGQPVTLQIRITNPGSGAATGVVLSESVPQGLSHPAGHILEFDVGTLKPGETRDLELSLTAAEAGSVTNILTARGEGNLQTEVQTQFDVIAPEIAVSMAGPKRRYLERNATHNISVSNPGTASAKEIELVAVLPQELKFVSANNNGQFDPATHSVYWSLEELPAKETGTVTLTTLPVKPGDAKLLIRSKAQENLADEREEVVEIDGIAAVSFQLSDASDPIEVNGQTTYEVRVTNQGTKAASNVQLVALLPAEMKGVSADGPARYRIEGQRVVFEPLRQLPAKGETIYKLTAQALQPGDLRLQVQLSSDEIRDPITKEESTRVYGNE